MLETEVASNDDDIWPHAVSGQGNPRRFVARFPDDAVRPTRMMYLRRLKLRPPALASAWIPRADASSMLPVQGHVLALVAGPGFGKTVLGGQLAAGWNGPVFWYTCDSDDRDLATFAAHLREMTSADARAGPASFPPPAAATAREVAANAAEVLADRANALVVFDDVHDLRGPSLEALADLVARASTRGVSFIVSGREFPDALRTLAVRGSLCVLSTKDLAFTIEQSREFLNAAAAGRLAPERIDELIRRVDGWPAGLALAASIPSRQREGSARDTASLEFVFDVLAAQVLDALDPREQRFLLETSVLDDLEVDACDAVSANTDARDLLVQFAQRGLFISRSGSSAFAVHRLFTDVLCDRFERDYPPSARAIFHERAAAYFARRGDDAKSIRHQLAAGKADAAAESLAGVALAFLAGGRNAQFARLLAGVGAERVAANPTLAIAQGRLQYADGAWDAALATLARANELARARGLPDIAAEAVRAMAPILGARGDHQRLGALLDATLQLHLSDNKRTMVSVTLGAHLLERGRFTEALTLYERIGPAVAELEDLALHGVVLHNTGVAHMRRGDPFAALTCYERALGVKRSAGQRVSALVTLGNLCIVERALGDDVAARRLSAEFVREARAVGDAAMLANALENAGVLALAAEEIDAAGAYFDEARRGCNPADTLFLPDALHGLAKVAIVHGDGPAAATTCARAAALLRAPGDEQRRAAVIVTRGRAALASGEHATALAFASEARELAGAGSDALTTAMLTLDVAALAAAIARLSTPDGAQKALAFGHEAAQAAFALIAARDYGFLERSQPTSFAAARELISGPAASGGAAAPGGVLHLRLLGALQVFVGGRELAPTAWKRRKAREIFAYLVCERGRLVSRTRLIDTFWPETDADAGSDNLRVCVSAIRRAVGDVVRFEDGGYRFAPPPGTLLDLDVFDSALNAARGARDRGDAPAARAAYADPLEVYRGDLLEGFEDGTWHLRERERLRDAALEAARALIVDLETDDELRARSIDRLLRLV